MGHALSNLGENIIWLLNFWLQNDTSRENSDLVSDTETVHQIKTIYLPANSGSHKNSKGTKTDFAIVELLRDVNTCSPEETKAGKCWLVTPVRLPDPGIYIKQLQTVRTMGNHSSFLIFSHWYLI